MTKIPRWMGLDRAAAEAETTRARELAAAEKAAEKVAEMRRRTHPVHNPTVTSQVRCDNCGGEGLVESEDPRRPEQICTACDGTGTVPTRRRGNVLEI